MNIILAILVYALFTWGFYFIGSNMELIVLVWCSALFGGCTLWFVAAGLLVLYDKLYAWRLNQRKKRIYRCLGRI